MLTTGQYLAGALFFIGTLGAVVTGATLVVRRRLGHLTGSARLLALGLVATVALLAVHLIPAALFVMSRETVLVAALAWLALAARLGPVVRDPDRRPETTGTDRASWLAAAAGLGLLALYALAVAFTNLTEPTTSIDTLNFHLPGVARWIDSGTIWQVDEFLPDVAPGNYPNNGDVMLLAALLPWENDFLAQRAIYPFFALAVLAVYGIARELGAARPAAIAFAATFGATPVVLVPALVSALVDSVMLAAFGIGVLFLIRHARTGATSDLVLAGLGLGVAFGTKWYGVSAVAIVVFVWAAGSLLAGQGGRAVARGAGVLTGLIGLTGGIWLLRNLILSGNPVFPVKVAPFGITIFDAPHDRIRELAGFTVAGYADEPAVWNDYLLPSFRDYVGGPGVYVLAGSVLAAVVLVARRDRVARPGVLAAALVCALANLVAYSVTPYSALGPEGEPVLAGVNTRYAMPAVLIAAGAGAWAAGALAPRWARVVAIALCIPAIAHAIRVDAQDPSGGAWAAAIACCALVVAAAWAWRRGLGGALPPPAVAAAVAAALAALLVAGYEMQQRFNDGRYAGEDEALDHLLAEAESGHRIGLAGLWTDNGLSPVFPAFGPRLGNEVEYLGRFVDEKFHRYHDRDDFADALERDGFDYLVVGRGRPPRRVVREERWARSVGWRALVRSDRLALYAPPG